jgi:hypothetical protein
MEAVEFYLEKSYFLGVLFIIIYLGSLLSLFCCEFNFFYKMIIVGFSLFFLQKNWKLHVNRKKRKAIVRVWQDSRGAWGFATRDGSGFKAILLPDTYRCRFLTILRFKTISGIVNIVIPYDALKPEEYCTLSRRLWVVAHDF